MIVALILHLESCVVNMHAAFQEKVIHTQDQ